MTLRHGAVGLGIARNLDVVEGLLNGPGDPEIRIPIRIFRQQTSSALFHRLVPIGRHEQPKAIKPNFSQTGSSLFGISPIPPLKHRIGFSTFWLWRRTKNPLPVCQNHPRLIKLERFVVRKSGSPAFDSGEVTRDLAHKGSSTLIDPIEAVAAEIMFDCLTIRRPLRSINSRRSHRKRLDFELGLAGVTPISPSLLVVLEPAQRGFALSMMGLVEAEEGLKLHTFSTPSLTG